MIYQVLRVNRDRNGNSRFVGHFLDWILTTEGAGLSVSELYDLALQRASKVGGRRYRGKNFAGGIVLQVTSEKEYEQAIALATAMTLAR